MFLEAFAAGPDAGEFAGEEQVGNQAALDGEDFLGGDFLFAGELHLGFTGGDVERVRGGVGDVEVVEVLVEGAVTVGVFEFGVGVDLALEFPVLEPFRFEADAGAAGFDMVAPDGILFAVVAVVVDVEVAVGIAIGVLGLQAALERELLKDRVALVLVESESGPGAVPRGIAGEFAEQEAGGGAGRGFRGGGSG